MRRIFPLAALMSVVALTGCAHDSNLRLELGVNHVTPTFSDREDTGSLLGNARGRAAWARSVVVSPIDGVRHSPSPRPIEVVSHKTPPREYGLYPTPKSAVTLDPDPGLGALVGPGAESGASVLSLFNPLIDGWRGGKPWSPQRVWKRTPANGAWYSGASMTSEKGEGDGDG